MNRRETIKSLLAGSVAGSLIISGCDTATKLTTSKTIITLPDYGRTESEKKKDNKILSETFFNAHELETLAHLADIILPAKGELKSATQVGVVDFIEFIAKDMPDHQLPLKGGIMWLDNQTIKRYQKYFVDCTQEQQKELCELIAFPSKTPKELSQGEYFFNRVRNLVLTGYYTSEDGMKNDLGYQGNVPNLWDGVPQEVLEEHGLEYDEEWLSKCVNQSKKDIQAEWDEDKNLIS